MNNTNLYSSIIEQERNLYTEHCANMLAQRFGLLYKIMISRSMSFLEDFDSDCDDLIRNYSNLIDNELHPSAEDKESSL